MISPSEDEDQEETTVPAGTGVGVALWLGEEVGRATGDGVRLVAVVDPPSGLGALVGVAVGRRVARGDDGVVAGALVAVPGELAEVAEEVGAVLAVSAAGCGPLLQPLARTAVTAATTSPARRAAVSEDGFMIRSRG
jgi:hypothetical protein